MPRNASSRAPEAQGPVSKSHRETVESHLRVHIGPALRDACRSTALDEERSPPRRDAAARRQGAEDDPNILSTLHSICDLAIRRGGAPPTPAASSTSPQVAETADIRYLTQAGAGARPPRGRPERRLGEHRTPAVPDGRDDRAAPGRADRPPLAGHRLAGLRRSASVRPTSAASSRPRSRDAAIEASRWRRASPANSKRTIARRLAFQDDDDLVFANPTTGGPLDRSKVRKRFQRACRRAGVRVVRFHDLRHTFGTRMAARGDVSMRTLQEWMGHRDPRRR